MKRTSLYEVHQASGATLVPFAGWEMPVSYSGTVREVAAVRARAGLFDVSHMGEVRVTGPGAFDFVQSVTTNEAAKLVPGKAQYSLLLNEQGGVIDDIIVYCIGPQEYLIVLNAGCKDKDVDWLQKNAKTNSQVTLTDESDSTALLALQGPEAVALAADVLGAPSLPEVKRFHFMKHAWQGVPLILSRTGYTGEDGFEIFCGWDDTPRVWQALIAAGATPAGLGARDVLRLEAAYPLYGHELDAETSPLESGVAWAVKAAKANFIGRDAVLARKRECPTAALVGLRMEVRAIPREHYPVLQAETGSVIGEVTSGTYSPTVQAGIALARLAMPETQIGTRVLVDIRGRRAGATVVALPFYRNGV